MGVTPVLNISEFSIKRFPMSGWSIANKNREAKVGSLLVSDS